MEATKVKEFGDFILTIDSDDESPEVVESSKKQKKQVKNDKKGKKMREKKSKKKKESKKKVEEDLNEEEEVVEDSDDKVGVVVRKEIKDDKEDEKIMKNIQKDSDALIRAFEESSDEEEENEEGNETLFNGRFNFSGKRDIFETITKKMLLNQNKPEEEKTLEDFGVDEVNDDEEQIRKKYDKLIDKSMYNAFESKTLLNLLRKAKSGDESEEDIEEEEVMEETATLKKEPKEEAKEEEEQKEEESDEEVEVTDDEQSDQEMDEGKEDNQEDNFEKDKIKGFMTQVTKGNVSKTEKEMKEDTLEDENQYDKNFFTESNVNVEDGGEVTFNMMYLSKPLLKSIDDMGYKTPTPIQQRCIPVVLNGHDVCASAVTGSGKTAAFMLPVLDRLIYRNKRVPTTRVLVLLPTRELAQQCFEVTIKLAKFTNIRVELVTGGVSTNKQKSLLSTKPDIIIATPGRLVDHTLNTVGFGLENVEILVLDEADRLLDMGFEKELETIVSHCPKNRQSLLFSATMTDNVSKLIKLSLDKPVRVAVGSRTKVAHKLIQEFVKVKEENPQEASLTKQAILLSMCSREFKDKTMIFFNKKTYVKGMKKIFFLKGLNCSELHGDILQKTRMRELEKFSTGETNFILCTDVAARGLDIKGVETIINMEMPKDLKTYIHRVGRTARAGKSGRAVTVFGEKDRNFLKKIVKFAKRSEGVVQQRIVSNEAIQFYKAKILKMKPNLEKVKEELLFQKELERAERDLERLKEVMGGTVDEKTRMKWVTDSKALLGGEPKANKKRKREENKGLKDEEIDEKIEGMLEAASDEEEDGENKGEEDKEPRRLEPPRKKRKRDRKKNYFIQELTRKKKQGKDNKKLTMESVGTTNSKIIKRKAKANVGLVREEKSNKKTFKKNQRSEKSSSKQKNIKHDLGKFKSKKKAKKGSMR